jgi:adenylyltransferase/sulfurtransferase
MSGESSKPFREEFARYHRQALLPDFGDDGQARICASHALIVGCGALGCGCAEMLARAGIGRLTIVDRDLVELTNLQRQVLFAESDARDGLPKAEAARRRLGAINSSVEIIPVVEDFNHKSAARIAGLTGDEPSPPDVILDGTDNFETRLVMNDLAVKHGIPYVYGGAVGTKGMQMTALPPRLGGGPPCLRCLVDRPPAPGVLPTCDTAGVLGPVISIVSGVQSTEALKILVGRADLVSRTLLEFDVWTGVRRRIDLAKLAEGGGCACCGQHRFEYLDGAAHSEAAAFCGQEAVQVLPADRHEVDLKQLAARLESHGSFKANKFMLKGTLERELGDQGQPLELTVFADGRTVVRGTRKAEVARSLHARLIGA